MKKKIVALAMLVLCLFVGLGFAAWTFTNNVSDNDTTEHMYVACAIESKDVKIYNGENEIDTIYLIFDAPASGIDGKVARGEGIFFASDEAGANKLTSLTIKAELTHIENNLHYQDANYKGVFTDLSALTDSHSYLNMTGGSFSTNNVVLSSSSTEISVTYTLPTFTYTTAFENAVTNAAALSGLFSGISYNLAVQFNLAHN